MKKSLLLICLFALNLSFAQQDKQLTHYMFDKMSFNPAATGFKGLCGTYIYRNQWDRVQDAPNTSVLNLQGNLPTQNLGLGLTFTNDAIGFQRNNIINLNGAFHMLTPYGVLSTGIGIGIVNVGFSPTWIPPQTYSDILLPDPVAGTGLDVNLGLYWTGREGYYVGLSTTHLAPPTLQSINYNVARHYYVLAGANRSITAGSRKVDLNPSVLVKADGATMVFDANIIGDFWLNPYSYLWGGLTYRLQDAVALNVGYAFSPAQNTKVNMVKIGYSFDIMTNPMNPYGKGTHELMLNVCIFPPPKPWDKHGDPFVSF